MNTMTAGSEKLQTASSWLEKIADGSADWTAAKAFMTGTMGVAADELPDAIDTYAKRMVAAKSLKNKIDNLTQSQQEAMIDLQTMVNRRDVAYSTSSNVIKTLGESQLGNAANF